MSFEIHDGPSLLLTMALIAVALVYLRGAYRLGMAFPKVLSGWRIGAFMGGLFSVWAAAGSSLAAMDHHLLIAHMVQHLLLMTVAAPLILLGAPAIALLHGLPQHFVLSSLVPFLRRSPVRRVACIITHPIFCWLSSTAIVIGWHVPTLFELGMQSQTWHEMEHVCFFVAGLLFWWPVIRPWPSLAVWSPWCVPLYLFLATLPCDALSAFLTFYDGVVYPHYLSAHRFFDISALGDQQCAGALMWVWVTFVYVTPAAVVTIQMLSPGRPSLKAEVV
jgi:cytochrome c oxidase assembly factor CtaG